MDANGSDLKIGDRVKHLHKPSDLGTGSAHGDSWHMFFGEAEIASFAGPCVVLKTNSLGRFSGVFLQSLVVKI